MSDPVVLLTARGLVKEFAAGGRRPTLYRALRSSLRGNNDGRRLRSLDDINIEVHAGEIIGVVGPNGAGKTTLLKTIAGLYAPTRGRVEVHGELALLAALGVGMIDELSVGDNVHLYGAVCGLHRRTIRERFDEIVGWAELRGFVGAELRTLSTGMQTRLAFAIAMHVTSDLILMDEAFSAGDKHFQDRCDLFFREAKHKRRTMLVATHNLRFVNEFCDRTLWLEKGKQIAFGPTRAVLTEYLECVSGQGARSLPDA